MALDLEMGWKLLLPVEKNKVLDFSRFYAKLDREAGNGVIALDLEIIRNCFFGQKTKE